MAIIRKGDALPTQADAANGYIVSGGKGRIRIGGVFINLSEIPFGSVSTNGGALHLHSDNLSGFEVLGSAFVDLEPGTGPATERLHLGSGSVVDKKLLGGKGTVVMSETGHSDIIVDLGTLSGSIEADATISYTAEGSTVFFYVE